MPMKDRRAALGNSMKAEEEAVKSRFERAETLLARNDAPSLATPETIAPPPLPHRNGVREEEPRVKRDSFTMPVADYELIATLQNRCLKAQTRANKSEILRAGLIALSALSEEDLAALVESLPKVKTGRPPVNLV
jgi:hypothetical protein